MNRQDYSTKDLSLAALLYTEGQTFLGLRREGDHFLFVFQEVDSSEKAAELYWQGKAITNAKAYADAIRTLKTLVFSQPRE